jgi:hypothetical protein
MQLQKVPAYTAKLQAMKKDMAALTAQVKALSVTYVAPLDLEIHLEA